MFNEMMLCEELFHTPTGVAFADFINRRPSGNFGPFAAKVSEIATDAQIVEEQFQTRLSTISDPQAASSPSNVVPDQNTTFEGEANASADNDKSKPIDAMRSAAAVRKPKMESDGRGTTRSNTA